jgi:ankyrin repeat protein
MELRELANYLYSSSKDSDKDELKGTFIPMFISRFTNLKSQLEQLPINTIKKLPTFEKFCLDDDLVPNEKAIRSYLTELEPFLTSPELIKPNQNTQNSSKKYKNQSLSSEDFADETGEITKETIAKKVKEKGDFKHIEHPISFPSQDKMVKGREIWDRVVKETKTKNRNDIKNNNIRDELVKRIKSLYQNIPDEKANRLLDYIIQRMQRDSVISVTFPTSFLNEQGFNKHRVASTFETNTKNNIYIDRRKPVEDKFISHTSKELQQQFKENYLSRPRYGKLALFGAGNVPDGVNYYGNSFLVLNDKIKFNATFTPKDTFTDSFNLSTIENLELLLKQMDNTCFNSIINWANNGTKPILDNIYKDLNYIEAQIPAINILNPEQVTNIHVDDSQEIPTEIQDRFKNLGIDFTNDTNNPFIIKFVEFFSLISSPNPDIKIVREYIEKYPFIHKLRDKKNTTTLTIAASAGNVEVVKLLIHELTGYSIDQLTQLKELQIYDQKLIANAISFSSDKHEILDLLQPLIPKVINEISLIPAISKSQNDFILELIKHGADINQLNEHGITPLITAVSLGNIDSTKLLIEQDAKLEATNINGETALMCAAYFGKIDALKILIEKGANLEAVNEIGNSVLIWALKNNKIDVLKVLIEKKANLDINIDGQPILCWAVKSSKLNILELLLKNGANANPNTTDGISPLMIAAENGQTEVVKLLLKHGAEPNAIDNKGYSIIDVAKTEEIRELVKSYKATTEKLDNKLQMRIDLALNELTHDSNFQEILKKHKLTKYVDENGKTEKLFKDQAANYKSQSNKGFLNKVRDFIELMEKGDLISKKHDVVRDVISEIEKTDKYKSRLNHKAQKNNNKDSPAKSTKR